MSMSVHVMAATFTLLKRGGCWMFIGHREHCPNTPVLSLLGYWEVTATFWAAAKQNGGLFRLACRVGGRQHTGIISLASS